MPHGIALSRMGCLHAAWDATMPHGMASDKRKTSTWRSVILQLALRSLDSRQSPICRFRKYRSQIAMGKSLGGWFPRHSAWVQACRHARALAFGERSRGISTASAAGWQYAWRPLSRLLHAAWCVLPCVGPFATCPWAALFEPCDEQIHVDFAGFEPAVPVIMVTSKAIEVTPHPARYSLPARSD